MTAKYKIYLQNLGIKELNAMQKKALTTIANHKEVILLSPTGSGKTLAFLLPLLSTINKTVDAVQCLILSPTRELALQTESVFKKMQTTHKINVCYGGHSMQVEKNNLKNPPKILVGTPGRINDHINRKTFSLKAINVLIIDEFDKCLEMGFQGEMKKIIRKLRLNQRILTSATALDEVPYFVGMQNEKVLDFLPEQNVLNEKLSLKAVQSSKRDKLEILAKLLKEIAFEPTIIFCNRKDAIDRVAHFLQENGLETSNFHGDLDQNERERAVIRFKNGSSRILLCTDLAARGLDIDNVKHIVHYHLPHKKDAFIHRNGRTARMHQSGTAYLIFAPEETLSFDYDKTITDYVFSQKNIYQAPAFKTIYLGKGKKDKINVIDIVGFFYKEMNLTKEDVGKIAVKDYCAYVAIKAKAVKAVLSKGNKAKIKGKTVKIELAS